MAGATERPACGTRLPRCKAWLLALTLLAATFIAYQPVWHAGFIWEDDDYVTENRALHSVDGLQGIWSKPGTTHQYYPLVLYQLLGGVSSLEVAAVRVSSGQCPAARPECGFALARAAAVEDSGRVVGRGDLCASPGERGVGGVDHRTQERPFRTVLFAGGAGVSSVSTVDGPGGGPRVDWRFYWLALGLFVCALLSKTVTCSLPAVLVLLLWWKTGRLEKRDGLALAPWFVLGAALGLMTRWMERRLGASRSGMGAVVCPALSRCRTGAVVLRGQTVLAAPSHLHLSALGNRCRGVVAVFVSIGRAGRAGRVVVAALAYRKRAAGGRIVLRDHACARAGFF